MSPISAQAYPANLGQLADKSLQFLFSWQEPTFMNSLLNRKSLKMFCKFLLSASISLVWMQGHVWVRFLEEDSLNIISNQIVSLSHLVVYWCCHHAQGERRRSRGQWRSAGGGLMGVRQIIEIYAETSHTDSKCIYRNKEFINEFLSQQAISLVSGQFRSWAGNFARERAISLVSGQFWCMRVIYSVRESGAPNCLRGWS